MILTQNIFKWLTISFLGIALFSVTIGQIIPFEFINCKLWRNFYDITLEGLPIVALMTMIWTLKKSKSKSQNTKVVIITILISICTVFLTFLLMFSVGFSTWVNREIIYENIDNPKQTINQQEYDMGALGYGGTRTVKLTPFLGIWNITNPIDTATIDRYEWKLVQKNIDDRFN